MSKTSIEGRTATIITNGASAETKVSQRQTDKAIIRLETMPLNKQVEHGHREARRVSK